MGAALVELDQRAALVAASPAGSFTHFQHGVALAVFWAVLAWLVGDALAHEAGARLAVSAEGLEGVGGRVVVLFGVAGPVGRGLVDGRDELAAGRVGAEDAGFPGSAVLDDGLEEELVLLAGED